MKPLILASASPQRRALLEGIGAVFEVHPSTVDEPAHPELSPMKRAQELARLKAQDVARRFPHHVVLGADTLVESARGTLLEKPTDAAEARAMLLEQSGSMSIVHSAVCLVAPDGQCYEAMDSSSVHFKKLTDRDIDWWVATRLWEGRSGGFQIDGLGQLMIERIEGDWTGIVGLPIYILGQLADQAGASLVDAVR